MMDDSVHSESQTPAADPPSDAPSPRAFATATGYVFQGVGLVLILGACGMWWLSAWFLPPTNERVTSWWQHLTGDNLPAALFMLAVLGGVVGGAGLSAAGFGLQAEVPRSGRAALIVTAVLTLVFGLLGLLLMFRAGAWISGILAIGMALFMALLFSLAVRSNVILRRYPPPPDQNKLTEEVLADIRRQRDERRKQFDL